MKVFTDGQGQPDVGEDPRAASGEERSRRENELLGEFVLTGLRRAPRGGRDSRCCSTSRPDGIVSVKRRISRPASSSPNHGDRDVRA